MTGFVRDDEAYGRPVGVAIDKAGALLVADDVGNAVWRVSGPATGAARPVPTAAAAAAAASGVEPAGVASAAASAASAATAPAAASAAGAAPSAVPALGASAAGR